MVTLDNYEEYLALYADGELTPAQQQALAAFMQQQPHLRAEMEAYGHARIATDDILVYPDKNALLKNAEAPKIIALNRKWIYGMAAAVLLIIFIATLYHYSGTENTGNTEVAKTNPLPSATNTTVAQQHVDIAAQAIPQQDVPQQEASVARHQPAPQKHKRNFNAPVNLPLQHPTPQPTPLEEHQPAERLATKPPHGVKDKHNEENIQQVPAPVVVETTQATPIPEKQKKSFLDNLPIDDDKKKGLETVASAIENIKDSKLSVKFTNKNLVINF